MEKAGLCRRTRPFAPHPAARRVGPGPAARFHGASREGHTLGVLARKELPGGPVRALRSPTNTSQRQRPLPRLLGGVRGQQAQRPHACGVTRSVKSPPAQVDVSSTATAVTMSLHTSRDLLGDVRASGCGICHPIGHQGRFAALAGEAGVPFLPDRPRHVPLKAGAQSGGRGRPSPTGQRTLLGQGARGVAPAGTSGSRAFPWDLFFEGKLRSRA